MYVVIGSSRAEFLLPVLTRKAASFKTLFVGLNRYLHDALAQTFSLYGGDPDRVVLVGWSRGAIACGAVGLHDDATSSLFKAFIPYSHLDGDCG